MGGVEAAKSPDWPAAAEGPEGGVEAIDCAEVAGRRAEG